MLKEHYYTEPTEIDPLIFEQLVPPDHYLRRVKQCLDFARFLDLVKDCYSPAMGRTAEDPVRMLKLEFPQCHYQLSDREVIAAAQVHVAFRCLLDLSLESPVPVPSLLAQFRTRLGVERHQALLDQAGHPSARAGVGPRSAAAERRAPCPRAHRRAVHLAVGRPDPAAAVGSSAPVCPGPRGRGGRRDGTPAAGDRRPQRRGPRGPPRGPPASDRGVGRCPPADPGATAGVSRPSAHAL
jgi:transposase